MAKRQSNISLDDSAIAKARDTDRPATIQLGPREEHASRRDLNSLYAALEHDAIAALAYRYWQERGCPEGSAAEDWLRAERDFLHRTEFGSPDYYQVGPVLRLPH